MGMSKFTPLLFVAAIALCASASFEASQAASGQTPLADTTFDPNAAGPATVSVTDFGAKPDGKTDSTSAFEKALATGLVIRVPASRKPFIVSRTLHIRGEQTFAGESIGGSRIQYVGSGPFIATPDLPTRFFNITIRDLTLLGNGDSGTDGILLARTNYSTIENVFIKDIGGTGIVMSGAPSSGGGMGQGHYAFISNVIVRGNFATALNIDGPVAMQGANRFVIEGLRVIGATDWAVKLGPYASTHTFYSLSIENCQNGVSIAGRSNRFYSLHMETIAGDAVRFESTARNNRFFAFVASKVGGSMFINPQANTLRDDENAVGNYPFLQ